MKCSKHSKINNSRNHIAVIITIVAALLVAPAIDGRRRTSKEVRRDRQKTEQQISSTKSKISANDKETSRQLNRLNLLNANIELRADTIRAIQQRIDSVNARIDRLNDSIAVLTERSQKLKDTYAHTLRTVRARRQSMNDISFIFSSKSFSQAWRRMRYLGEIAKTSTRQARQVKIATDNLAQARIGLDSLKVSHSRSLAALNAAQNSMQKERASANELVAGLRKESKSLQRELRRRRDQAAALDQELNRVIDQEIREAEARRLAEEKARREAEEKRRAEEKRLAEEKARKEAEAEAKAQAAAAKKDTKKKPAKKPVKPTKTEPAKPEQAQVAPPKKQVPKATNEYAARAEADRKLSGSFAANKGKLLFPVAGRYTITSNFGTYDHPDFAKVKMNNLGIDIEVPRGTSTRAVFDGVVSSIFRLDGYHSVVILRHGEYLTVYAGIDALAVKKGQSVKAGQTLGALYSDPDDGGRTSLHFEIRHEKQKLNPVEWVK